MRRLLLCLGTLVVTLHGANSRAAPATDEPAYTFTINGQSFVPRCFSLRGDPDHPAPGDLIAIGPLLLTLGPERDCRFVVATDESKYGLQLGKVSLRLADGRQRVVGVYAVVTMYDGEKHVANPLQDLSPDEIHGLWGVGLCTWTDEVAKKLRHIDPARACVVLDPNATVEQGGKRTFPPLPTDIRYLDAEELRDATTYEPLRQWPQLRFLRISGNGDGVFDPRWLAKNGELRRLDVCGRSIEHPEALSQLERLESLDLPNISNLATVEFVAHLSRLRSLNVADTAVWDLSALAKNDSLTRLNVSYTKVRDLAPLEAKNLEELDISETMVRDLSPLWKLKKLKKVTATGSTVEKLPNRAMPLLRNLTVFSTPLPSASIDVFAKRNPQCAVMLRWSDALRSATVGATRLRIRSNGPGFGHYELIWLLQPRNTLLEITDPAQIREFVRLIEIDEKNSDNGCWDGCCLEHGPTFEFYAGDKSIAAVGWTAIGLSWSRNWPMLDGRLTSQSRERVTKWLAEHGYRGLYDMVTRQTVEERNGVKQHAAIVSCYPERARTFFKSSADDEDAENDENVKDAKGTENDKEPLDKPAQIAKAIGDPVELAIITCRAVGSLDVGTSLKKGEPKLVVDACRKVDERSFLKGLDRIGGDRQAELGAARLYFRETDFQWKIPRTQQLDWMLRFATIMLNQREGGDILREFVDENYAEPEIVAFLRKIARGQLGRDVKPADGKATLRTLTYLKLAEHGVPRIQAEIETALAKTTRKPDAAALEIALAFLGNPKHLKPEHLKSDSPDPHAALRAIEKFDGREGMDILVQAGLDNSDDSVQNESLLLFQQITKQEWYKMFDGQEPRQFVGDAKKWWREHGDEFIARRRAEGKPQTFPRLPPSSQ